MPRREQSRRKYRGGDDERKKDQAAEPDDEREQHQETQEGHGRDYRAGWDGAVALRPWCFTCVCCESWAVKLLTAKVAKKGRKERKEILPGTFPGLVPLRMTVLENNSERERVSDAYTGT